MKIIIANYNEHYVVDVSTKDERDIKFCLVQKIGGDDAIKEADVIITFNYSDVEEYFKVEKNIPNLSNDEIEKLVNDFKSSDLYKPYIKPYKVDFRYIVIDYDSYCISKTNDLTDDIKGMIEQGYYRVIDLQTIETIDSNKNGLFRKEITNY
jgi:hypothetical protein